MIWITFVVNEWGEWTAVITWNKSEIVKADVEELRTGRNIG